MHLCHVQNDENIYSDVSKRHRSAGNCMLRFQRFEYNPSARVRIPLFSDEYSSVVRTKDNLWVRIPHLISVQVAIGCARSESFSQRS